MELWERIISNKPRPLPTALPLAILLPPHRKSRRPARPRLIRTCIEPSSANFRPFSQKPLANPQRPLAYARKPIKLIEEYYAACRY